MEKDTEQITVTKRSWPTIFKTVLGSMALALLMNAFSAVNVALSHAYNKGLGLATDFVDFCTNCLQALAG